MLTHNVKTIAKLFNFVLDCSALQIFANSCIFRHVILLKSFFA